MRTVVSALLSGVKYLLGIVLMYAGITTMLLTEPVGDESLGFIYESKVALVVYGLCFFASGMWLVLAKVTKKRHQVGNALMACYLCFVYAGFLNWSAYTFEAGAANFVISFAVGLLYLRWRYHILYSDRVDMGLQPV